MIPLSAPILLSTLRFRAFQRQYDHEAPGHDMPFKAGYDGIACGMFNRRIQVHRITPYHPRRKRDAQPVISVS